MTEFSGLGKQCFLCQQLDFLPFHCTKCNHHFCLKHRVHNCDGIDNTKGKMVNFCHKCGDYIKEDPIYCSHCKQYYCLNHRYHNCKHKKKVKKHKVKSNPKYDIGKCSFKNCKEKYLDTRTCQFCKKEYCLTHRHHDCINKTVNKIQPKTFSGDMKKFLRWFRANA